MEEQSATTNRIQLAGSIIATGLAFSLPLSNSGHNIFALLLLLLWLFSGRFLHLPNLLRINPVVVAALLLFSILIIGLFHSPVDMGVALKQLKKYRELLFICAFIPFLADKRSRKWAEWGFFGGIASLLIVSFLLWFDFFPSLRFHDFPDPSPISRIPHNTIMAFATFWAAHRMLDSNGTPWPWAIGIGFAIFNIFFMVGGRTGQLIFIVLALLFFRQRFSWKKSLAGGLILLFMLGSFFVFSKSFSGRINDAVSDIQSFETKASQTSLGQRYQFLQNSLQLYAEAPFIGHGTGSFKHQYAKLVQNTNDLITANPHNEYLLIAVQTGSIGLALFLLLLAIQFRYAGRLPQKEVWFAQGITFTMAVGCLFNSFLLDSTEGHFYAFFTALFFAQLDIKKIPNTL